MVVQIKGALANAPYSILICSLDVYFLSDANMRYTRGLEERG